MAASACRAPKGRFVDDLPLSRDAKRIARVHEPRLDEVDEQPTVERGPAALHPGGTAAAEEVDVAQARRQVQVSLRSVASTERVLPMLGFFDANLRIDVTGQTLPRNDFDRGALEQFLRSQTAFAFSQQTGAEQCTRSVHQLPPDQRIVDAGVANNVDRAEERRQTWLRGEREPPTTYARTDLLLHLNARIGISAVAELEQRKLARRHQEIAIQRPTDGQGKTTAQRLELAGPHRVETAECDRFDQDRLTLGDDDRQVDLPAIIAVLHVGSGHARVGVTTVGVELGHAKKVGFERRFLEGALLAPGQEGPLARFERIAEPRLVDKLDTFEDQALDADGLGLARTDERQTSKAAAPQPLHVHVFFNDTRVGPGRRGASTPTT